MFMEKEELKLKHLIALRNNYFSMIMLISSGVAGLFLAKLAISKMLFLMFVGAYFDCIFISKFIYVNNEIKMMLEDKE